jgi:hypothetical protein
MPGTPKAGNSRRTSEDFQRVERKVHQEHATGIGNPSVEVCLVKELNKDVRRVSLEMTKRRSRDQEGPEAASGHLDLKFHVSHGLTTPEAEELMRQWGRNELVEKITPIWLIVLRLVMSNISH